MSGVPDIDSKLEIEEYLASKNVPMTVLGPSMVGPFWKGPLGRALLEGPFGRATWKGFYKNRVCFYADIT